MESLTRYAAQFATPQLQLPHNERFSVDARRIQQTSVSLAARLPTAQPAVVLDITKVSESIPDAKEFSKAYQREMRTA
jgi:hypothetical protein